MNHTGNSKPSSTDNLNVDQTWLTLGIMLISPLIVKWVFLMV